MCMEDGKRDMRPPFDLEDNNSLPFVPIEPRKRLKTSEINYYKLSAKLPMEILARIFVWLDSKTIHAIIAATPQAFTREAEDVNRYRRGLLQWKLDYLWRSFATCVLKRGPLFYEEAISCQHAQVASVFTRDPMPWSFCPKLSLWGKMDSEEAFQFCEHWDSRTEYGVRAIQRGLPGMKQTNMVRFYFLRLWFWYGTSTRCPATHRSQESWNYFAALPRRTQEGIMNFFDNLTCCFLDVFPPKYPSDCDTSLIGSSHCYCVCQACRTAGKWQGRGHHTCWKIPWYIPSELQELGVTDIFTKQLIINKLANLYKLLNTQYQGPLEARREMEILSFFDPSKRNNGFWTWNPKNGPVLLRSGTRFVMRLDNLAYEVWVHGKRGNGRIELRLPLALSHRRDWSRLFEAAMRCGKRGKKPLQVNQWVRQNIVSSSYVIERKRYWCWTEWDLRGGKDIGLDRILFD